MDRSILLGDDGHVVLENLRSRPRDSAYELIAGRMVGTPEYMAPEMVLGQPFNHKIDFWALGCLLYAPLSCTSTRHQSTA